MSNLNPEQYQTPPWRIAFREWKNNFEPYEKANISQRINMMVAFQSGYIEGEKN